MKHVLLHILFSLLICSPTAIAADNKTNPVSYELIESKDVKPIASGYVIYLNGPSSAGKGTVAKLLQKELKEPYLHIGIDRLIEMMPEKVNDWSGNRADLVGFSWETGKDDTGTPIKVLRVGSYAQKMMPLLRELVRTMVHEGHNVIVDDVSFGKSEVDKWRQALKNERVVWIGLSAPVEILEKREKQRGDRVAGSARAQAALVHKDVEYDVFFDSSLSSNEEMVKAIMQLQAKKGFIK